MKQQLVKHGEKLAKLIPEDDDVIDLSAIEIDGGLVEQIDSDGITSEWLKDNAPWNQWGEETDEEYAWFRFYTQLPIDVWKPKASWESSPYVEITDVESWGEAFNRYEWVKRRMAFVKYREWVERKRDELQQLQHIAEFRNSQALLMGKASSAGILLVDKLTKRINTLNPDEIKPHNIPAFVGALGTFLSMASDAEARLLAITDLLEHYESDIASADLREHLFMINEGEITE